MPGNRPLVSILIPVYNAEATLSRCLDSAAGQSLGDLEIVCVDDASTDGSANIIRGFEGSDKRIRHISHASNQGEGAARNTALDDARGDYVFHLDADDTLPPTALEKLWTIASRHGSQMVKGGFSITDFHGRIIASNHEASPGVEINTSIRSSAFLRRIPVSHCSYLYERAFLDEHGLRYRTDMPVGLDLVALSAALIAADRVSLLPDVVYHYRRAGQSATSGSIQPDTVRYSIRAKALVHDNLLTAGLREAARDCLTLWDWQLKALWANLAVDTPATETTGLFQQFRETIPEGLVPWRRSSPLTHRYFLSLILQGRDPEARAFLPKLSDAEDFDNHPAFPERCATILEVAPDDALTREQESSSHV
jgi:glycosyltransferase involved in cell wall biosynthesis